MSAGKPTPRTDDAVRQASREGVDIFMQYRAESACIELLARNIKTGLEVREMVEVMRLMHTEDEAVAITIEKLCRQVKSPHPTEELDMLRRQLEQYRTAVKQLSFELEMSKGAGKVNLATNVAAIRKMALEQAAEFVMDWGIPKDGHDLEELCKQIPNLKETKALAINRAIDAMDIFFNGGKFK